MLNLYKRGRTGTRFWQAWTHGAWGVTNEGTLGVRGKMKHLKPQVGKKMAEIIAEAVQKQRAKGYAEITPEEHFQVVVQYRLETWGSVDDLGKGHKIEFLFNECLGWTGNGRCDGNDIGSGSMNIFSIVVDHDLAVETMGGELRKKKLLKGAVIAVRHGEEYRVAYPLRYKGEFSLL
jgi:hypothetical protein